MARHGVSIQRDTVKKLLVFIGFLLATIATMALYSSGRGFALSKFVNEWWISFLVTAVFEALAVWVFPKLATKWESENPDAWGRRRRGLYVFQPAPRFSLCSWSG